MAQKRTQPRGKMVNVNVKDTSSISNNDGDDVDLHVLFRIKEYQMITVEIPQYNSNNTNTNGLNHQLLASRFRVAWFTNGDNATRHDE